MMPDLWSSHQSVTTLTVLQLYNCGFSTYVSTGTKTPHLPLFDLAALLVGARCAWPGLAQWRKGWAATPSAHSIQPSWLHRLANARACADALSPCERALVPSFTPVSSTTRASANDLSKLSARDFSEYGWTASSSVCVDATMRRFAYARLSSYIQPKLLVDVDLTSQTHFSPSSGHFRRRRRSVTRLAVGHPTSPMMTKPTSIHIQILIPSFLTSRSRA